MDPTEMLAAFEAEHLGEDAPRHGGKIEKGHGSFFQRKLTEPQKRHHAALERLVETAANLAHAHQNHEKAKHEHDAALGKVAEHEAEAAPKQEHVESESVRAAREEPHDEPEAAGPTPRRHRRDLDEDLGSD